MLVVVVMLNLGWGTESFSKGADDGRTMRKLLSEMGRTIVVEPFV